MTKSATLPGPPFTKTKEIKMFNPFSQGLTEDQVKEHMQRLPKLLEKMQAAKAAKAQVDSARYTLDNALTTHGEILGEVNQLGGRI